MISICLIKVKRHIHIHCFTTVVQFNAANVSKYTALVILNFFNHFIMCTLSAENTDIVKLKTINGK